MRVRLKYLKYTVRFKRLTKAKRKWFPGAYACTVKDHGQMCTIYLRHRPPQTRKHQQTLVHELTHALQYICEDRQIRFDEEKEQMAYLMAYLFRRATKGAE